MKRKYVIGIGMLAIFIFFSISTLKNSLSPYVSFAEAKSLEGRNIQIKGTLVSHSITENKGENFQFVLCNEVGEEVAVSYQGGEPYGFREADNIVAVGNYREGQFNATKVLVKCPSKYQKSQEVVGQQ